MRRLSLLLEVIDMSPMLNDEQTQRFSALEDMAKSVVWQQSTFLRSIGKQVLHLQTQFQS